MKKTIVVISFLAATLAGCNNTPLKETTTQKSDSTTTTTTMAAPATAQPQMDSTTIAKNLLENTTPGDMQKMLASLSGKWAGEVSSWYGEHAPAQKNTTECENKMILDGRYLQRTRTQEVNGKTMEGMGIIGYDNAKKMFVSSWQDNLSTGIMYLEGPYDAATKTITLKGKWMNPATGSNTDVKETFKIIDDNTHQVALYKVNEGGSDFKCWEMNLTRK